MNLIIPILVLPVLYTACIVYKTISCITFSEFVVKYFLNSNKNILQQFCGLYINVREYRRANQKWAIQRK